MIIHQITKHHMIYLSVILYILKLILNPKSGMLKDLWQYDSHVIFHRVMKHHVIYTYKWDMKHFQANNYQKIIIGIFFNSFLQLEMLSTAIVYIYEIHTLISFQFGFDYFVSCQTCHNFTVLQIFQKKILHNPKVAQFFL